MGSRSWSLWLTFPFVLPLQSHLSICCYLPNKIGFIRIGVREHFLFKEKEKVFQFPVFRSLARYHRVCCRKCRQPARCTGCCCRTAEKNRSQEIPAASPVHRVLLPEMSVSSPVHRVLLPGSPVRGPVLPGQIPGCSTLPQTVRFLSPTFSPTVTFRLGL